MLLTFLYSLMKQKWIFLLKSLHCFYLAMISGSFPLVLFSRLPHLPSMPAFGERGLALGDPLGSLQSSVCHCLCLSPQRVFTASTLPPQEPPGVLGWPGLVMPQGLGREIRGRKGAAQLEGHLWI